MGESCVASLEWEVMGAACRCANEADEASAGRALEWNHRPSWPSLLRRSLLRAGKEWASTHAWKTR